MDSLKDTLVHVMGGYAGKALNGCSYLTSNDDQDVFAVVSVGEVKDKRIADAALIVRLIDDKIIIERDINDKPLVDALIQAGVSRERIFLAYTGEPAPAAA